jgi:hypothetical protein
MTTSRPLSRTIWAVTLPSIGARSR